MKNYFNLSRKAIIVGLCGVSIAGAALAMPVALQDKEKKIRIGTHAQFEREYTIPELTTLVEASLLRHSNTPLELEGIGKTDEGTFNVALLNTESNEKQEIELNKYGFAVEGASRGLFFHGKRGKHSSGKNKHFGAHNERKSKHEKMHSNKRNNKELTLKEITTLIQARMLSPKLDSLKIGEINATDAGFNVTILAQDNSLVKRIQLNKSGFPERKMNPKE